MYSFRGTIESLVSRIFFKKPLKRNDRDFLEHQWESLRHFARIVFFAMWIVPWICFAVWYLVVVYGCESYSTRRYLEGVCIRPHSNHDGAIPWYLDLWNSSAARADRSDTSPLYIENIMISHLKIRHAETDLRQQISKMNETLSGIVWDNILVNLHQVTATAADVSLQLENFSLEFCIEKDIMNHAFRTAVEAYVRTITRSEYVDLSTSSIIIFPIWSFALRLINQFTLIPLLPEPRLFSLQAKSEIRFQMKQFVDESMKALQRIDASSLSVEGYQHSTRLFEVAIDSIKNFQYEVNQTIHDRKTTSKLERQEITISEQYHASYALSECTRNCILIVQETMEVCEAHLKELRTQLQYLGQGFVYTPSFEFSPASLVAVPKSFLGHVQGPHYSWRMQSSSASKDSSSGSRSITDVTPHSHVYYYDLDTVDDTRILTLRSELAQLCRDRKNGNMVSGSLYIICNIWTLAATMSDLDYDILNPVQKSWVLEREEAIRRYERQISSDYENGVNLLVDTFRDYQRGTPVPHISDVDG